MHISSNNSVKIPKPVLDFLKSTQDLTSDLIKNPIGQDWKQQFEQLRQETSQIKQDIHAVRIATANTTTAGPSTRIRSYVDAVKNAPAPTHLLSSHGSASTSPAAPTELIHDRQVIVKLGDPDGVKRFRTQTSAEITKLAEKARVKAAKEVDGLTMASAMFVAARQLKSGDLSLSLRTAKEAEIMRCHRQVWVKHLWKGSEVRLPSWGVVVHDVNVRSLGIDTAAGIRDRKQGIIKQLLTENLFSWGDDAEIVQISWLVLPEGKKSGSLIVEFMSPHTANKSIDTGTLWDSEVLTTVLYDRAARIRQCHNCQKYGHIGSTCSNQTNCVFCAEQHHSRDCQRKKDATLSQRKCANCGGAHNGWSKRCPDFIKEIERVQILAQARERYHRVPAYLSIQDTGKRIPATPTTTRGEGSSGGSGSGVSTKESSLSNSSKPSKSRESAKTTKSKKSSRSTVSEKESSFSATDAMEIDTTMPSQDVQEIQTQAEPQPQVEDQACTADEGIAPQTQEVPDFTYRRADVIGDSLRQSIHAPKGVRSEPPRRRAPSRASTSSSVATRSKGLLGKVLQVNKKARREHKVFEDGDEDVDPISVIETSSIAARSASDYQPSSVLSQINNSRTYTAGRKTQKAPGKENMPAIFDYDRPARTPGPKGRNKRTHDDQVDLTMSAPSVRFTNRADIHDERRTRQFTRKQAQPVSNE
jgi:hypothetical protein